MGAAMLFDLVALLLGLALICGAVLLATGLRRRSAACCAHGAGVVTAAGLLSWLIFAGGSHTSIVSAGQVALAVQILVLLTVACPFCKPREIPWAIAGPVGFALALFLLANAP